MDSQQQLQHSKDHQGSSTILHRGSNLCKLCLLGNKWTVSSSYSTVKTIRAAVPSYIGAAIFASCVFLATNGQSAAVTAQ